MPAVGLPGQAGSLAAAAPAGGQFRAFVLVIGGRLVTGAFTGPPGRLPELLTELRTVRSGGRAWPSDELVAAITAAGFAGAAEVDRTWMAPVRLHVAHRAG